MVIMNTMTKPQRCMALLAAALIGVSAFTAQGGSIEWTISEGFMYNIEWGRDFYGGGLGDFLGVSIYLIDSDPYSPFMGYIATDFSEGFFDESNAFSPSIKFEGWEPGDPPYASLSDNSVLIDENLIPSMFRALVILHFQDGFVAGYNPGGFDFSDSGYLYGMDFEDIDWPFGINGSPILIMPVPEPTTGLLALIGAATLLLRRRKRE